MDEDLPEGVAVAVDFGGGTFDVAVIKFAPDGGDVIGLAGVEIGGEQFDRLLFQAKVAPALHLDDTFRLRSGAQRSMPNWLKSRLATLSGLKSLLSDPNTVPTLSEYRAAQGGEHLATVENILYGGYGYQFYRAIEDAKIALSTDTRTMIDFHRPGIELSIPVTRTELEQLIAKPMEAVREAVLRALDIAGIAPHDVNLVLRTGGSSSIPAFLQVLEDIFDPSAIQERPVYTTVVRGLASYAQELWA